MKSVKILLPIVVLFAVFSVGSAASDPTATKFSDSECLGTARPYPVPDEMITVPDTLTPIFINHIGRHGARFLASPAASVKLAEQLAKADSAGTLTALGREMLDIVRYVIDFSHNRWGALDSLGMAEQRGIATRMFRTYPKLFIDGKVEAISSYAPRCVMSMYEFTHQLDRLNNNVEIFTSSGRQNSPLMRPFDTNADFEQWFKSKPWEAPYDMFFETMAPASPARRLVGDNTLSAHSAAKLSWDAYSVLRGLPAMGMDFDILRFFSIEELNALWACENLGHYLKRSATTLSTEPADIASDLLLDLISTADAAADGKADAAVQLRFGHAETLMPLLSLMRLRGCYYLTNYFDTVALHWRDFMISPMSGNLQMILFKTAKGVVYVRFELNEQPVALMPDSDDIIIPWSVARNYLMRCLPMHMQI